ncbi:MAG: VCBS repeat-containing protein [Candidatus Omnitrophica bacterium]|nr:VCBS repeat-containing protein [Candidatus Omnitrophota bacterium]
MLKQNKNLFPVLIFTLIFSMLTLSHSTKTALASEPDFTIVVIPDTQYEVSKYPQMWKTMTQWIVDNASTQNIKAVIGVGDMTNTHRAPEFQTAQDGFNLIGNKSIPYVPLIGNHDYNDVTNRIATTYDAYFGPNQLNKKPWYGDSYPKGSNQNFYIKFDVGTHKYLVIALEFYPRSAAIAWAQNIINAYPNREVIVVTHAYLTNNAEKVIDTGMLFGPLNYHLVDYNNGQQLWDEFIKINKNIILTLNGHFADAITTTHRTNPGINGNLVHQLFTDYESQNYGDGYMMLLKFQPNTWKIQVSFYSPILKTYDPKNSTYTLSYTALATPIILPSTISQISDPILMDLNNDGQLALAYIKNGQTIAYNNKGLLPGFPWNTHFNIISPAISDLNGDGKKEIIGGCDRNKLCVYDSNGNMVSGWPKLVGGDITSSPAIADLDKDGQKEIVIGTDHNNSTFPNQVYVFHPDGSLLMGWPKNIDSSVSANPVIADINGDDVLDIVVADWAGTIHVWDKNGVALPGWPRKLPSNKYDYAGYINHTSPAVADINNDGKKEIVICDSAGHVFIFKADGFQLRGWPKEMGSSVQFSSPAIGDVDGDGEIEVAAGSFDGNIYLWKSTGQLMPGWPQSTINPIFSSPVLIDIDHDSKLEIALNSTNGKIYLWKYDGSAVAGWPKQTNSVFLTSPVFGDFDNDGKLNLIAAGNKSIYKWKLP